MSEEYWRSVPDAPTYLVSDLGRVARLLPGGTWRVLRQARNSKGYLKVSLGRQRQEYVHRLVALAFIGEQPGEDYEVDHIDECQTNNWLVNLRWLPGEVNNARRHEREQATEDDARVTRHLMGVPA